MIISSKFPANEARSKEVFGRSECVDPAALSPWHVGGTASWFLPSTGSRCFLVLLGGRNGSYGTPVLGPYPPLQSQPSRSPQTRSGKCETRQPRPHPPAYSTGPGALRTCGPGLSESPSLVSQQPGPQAHLTGFAVTGWAPGGQGLDGDRGTRVTAQPPAF